MTTSTTWYRAGATGGCSTIVAITTRKVTVGKTDTFSVDKTGTITGPITATLVVEAFVTST